MRTFAQRRLLSEAKVLLLVALPFVLADFSGRAQSVAQSDGANQHKIRVQFDYDFSKDPSCAEKPKQKTCVKQFDVYDVSGQRFRLFSIPAPSANGKVKEIRGESPARVFLPGTHFIAVTAENAQGVESETARVKVEIKPKTSNDSPAPK